MDWFKTRIKHWPIIYSFTILKGGDIANLYIHYFNSFYDWVPMNRTTTKPEDCGKPWVISLSKMRVSSAVSAVFAWVAKSIHPRMNPQCRPKCRNYVSLLSLLWMNLGCRHKSSALSGYPDWTRTELTQMFTNTNAMKDAIVGITTSRIHTLWVCWGSRERGSSKTYRAWFPTVLWSLPLTKTPLNGY
jgi:hypothetical protein